MGYTYGKKKKTQGMTVEDIMPLERCPRYHETTYFINGKPMVRCKDCGWKHGNLCTCPGVKP